MEALGALSGIFFLFMVVVAILAFLLPFFVLRIRNEMIKLNENMVRVIELLGGQSLHDNGGQGNPTKKIKVCPYCGTKNRAMDYTCVSCSKPI